MVGPSTSNPSLILQADDGLRLLRFRLVPKYCSEGQFWNRYFAAVARVKQQVRAEQMWGDFDMLTEDDSCPHGEPYNHPPRLCPALSTSATLI